MKTITVWGMEWHFIESEEDLPLMLKQMEEFARAVERRRREQRGTQ